MKKIILAAAMCVPILLFAQCKKAPANAYSIEITAEGNPVQALLNYASGDDVKVDTAVLNEGVFEFKGVTDEPMSAMLIVSFAHEEAQGAGPTKWQQQIIVEPGEIIVHLPQQWNEATVGGTPSNDEAAAWNAEVKPLYDEAQAMNSEFMAMTPEEQQAQVEAMRARYNGIQEQLDAKAAEYVAAHPDSWFALSSLWNMVVKGQDADKGQQALDGFSEKVRATKLGVERQAMVDAWRSVAVGATAPDFKQADVDGNEIALSSLRGKWVLIDFWASWCGPCRAENPNVVAAYNAFKDKNFTIMGVSLDSNREAWIKAIADDHLDWTQVSDVKGWGNEAAKLYSVRSIPANFLLNPEGVIVARNLREEELHAKLAELLLSE